MVGGAGPGDNELLIDLDSTICEVHGDHKQGAAYGYTRQLGLHPLPRCVPTPANCCTGGCAKVRRRAAIVVSLRT